MGATIGAPRVSMAETPRPKRKRPAFRPAIVRNFVGQSVVRAASHRRGDPLLELLLRRGADLARGQLAALEDHQRRDRLDAVLGGGVRVLVDVELDDLHLAVERSRDLLEGGGDHPAGAAPFGPEVHHDRAGRLQHLGFESGVRNLADGHGTYLFFAGGGEAPRLGGRSYGRARTASRRLHGEVTVLSAASRLASEISMRSGTSVQIRAARTRLSGNNWASTAR